MSLKAACLQMSTNAAILQMPKSAVCQQMLKNTACLQMPTNAVFPQILQMLPAYKCRWLTNAYK